MDLESWEFALRQAVLAAGANLLEEMLEGLGSGRQEQALLCDCGAKMKGRGRKYKRIKTILGKIQLKRSSYVCEQCGSIRIPADEILGVRHTGFSPGVRRMMARAGQRDTFKEARDDLKIFAEIEVCAKDVERVAEATGRQIEEWQTKERAVLLEAQSEVENMEPIEVMYVSYDGTGVPMVPWEPTLGKGKQKDASSKTREVKLGCVFTQTKRDEKGFPIRDEDSATFVGAIESSTEFGLRIYAEALRRGLEKAKKVVIIADGARYNWEIAALHFPHCIQIVDLYHAREHLHELCGLVIAAGGSELIRMETHWRTILDEGRVEDIINCAAVLTPRSGKRKTKIKKEIGYFENNAHRMRYADYRAQGLFVGSGVVEAGCKTVIGKRLKQSAMKWTVRGANSIIALRCCHISGRIEDFWEQKIA